MKSNQIKMSIKFSGDFWVRSLELRQSDFFSFDSGVIN